MTGAFILFAALGLDTLAVAVSLGVRRLPRAQWARVGLTFALFEGGMPVLGLFLGRHLSGLLGGIATYTAAGILVILGGLEIREALGTKTERDEGVAPIGATVRATLFRGLSVSLDELAVGFSLGVLHVPVGPALIYVAVQAFAFTFLGLWLGTRVGARLGERAELAAGVLLVLLGLALVANETTGAHWL
jgi:putative Mn2+ efflux pump MntP